MKNLNIHLTNVKFFKTVITDFDKTAKRKKKIEFFRPILISDHLRNLQKMPATHDVTYDDLVDLIIPVLDILASKLKGSFEVIKQSAEETVEEANPAVETAMVDILDNELPDCISALSALSALKDLSPQHSSTVECIVDLLKKIPSIKEDYLCSVKDVLDRVLDLVREL